MSPFIVYGLPRSRSFWLSRYLSYGDWACGHDEIRHARSLDDVKAWFSQPCTGTVETAAAPWWRLIQRYQPEMRSVVIRRPVSEVLASLARLGYNGPLIMPILTKMDRKLDQITARVPGVLSVDFDDLNSEQTRARVFEHCLPYKHDPAWDAIMSPLNLQINLATLGRYHRAYQPQMDKLAKVGKQQIIAGMGKSKEIEGVTIQEEPFDTAWRDGEPLMAAHCVRVGEAPDNWMNKNVQLVRVLARAGALQIMTARSNGRMFGYLVSLIGPSLESADITSAESLSLFVSPEIPGLGMKLHRASIDTLRAKGVNEIVYRAGVRGSGPKLGAIFRRLGADDFGQIYKLVLD